MTPPADIQALTHCVLKAELGKPVFFLVYMRRKGAALDCDVLVLPSGGKSVNVKG